MCVWDWYCCSNSNRAQISPERAKEKETETCQWIFKHRNSQALFTNDFPPTAVRFCSNQQMIRADNRHKHCSFINKCAHYSSLLGSASACVLACFKQRDLYLHLLSLGPGNAEMENKKRVLQAESWSGVGGGGEEGGRSQSSSQRAWNP